MIPNLPPHLQEKMDNLEEEMVKIWRESGYANNISLKRYGFEKGYEAMYFLILQELGPVVELVNGGYEQMQYMNPNRKESAYNEGVLNVCRRISKHLKKRILNGNNT